jgi:SAM-dependent methyltransferase
LTGPRPTLRCPCAGRYLAPGFTYNAPPEGETRFDLGEVPYIRAYDRCTECEHWFARHTIDIDSLYLRNYVDATYGGPDGMRARLERILALPPERSDNAGRVNRIISFAEARFDGRKVARRLLDVGAGIGVFAATMKAAGWAVVAIEPDPRTARHLREWVGVEAYACPIAALDPVGVGRFDIVAFNKVLEHVEDPIALLTAAHRLLEPSGFVYLEVPDAETASAEGPGREEFFIEHHHVFSAASVTLTGERAGYMPYVVQQIREPSTKFTLFAVLIPK